MHKLGDIGDIRRHNKINFVKYGCSDVNFVLFWKFFFYLEKYEISINVPNKIALQQNLLLKHDIGTSYWT